MASQMEDQPHLPSRAVVVLVVGLIWKRREHLGTKTNQSFQPDSSARML